MLIRYPHEVFIFIENNVFVDGIFQADNFSNTVVRKNIFRNTYFNLTSAHFSYNVFDKQLFLFFNVRLMDFN